MEQKQPKLTKMPFGKKKQLEQDLAKISQEMYKRNAELAETNQTLLLLRRLDSLVLESHDKLSVLCQNMANVIIANSSLGLVGFMVIPPNRNHLQLMGWSSSYDSVPPLESLSLDLNDGWLVGSDRDALIDITKLSDHKLASTLQVSQAAIAQLRKGLPVKTVRLVKLLARHRLVGVMFVGTADYIDDVPEKSMAFVDRLSSSVEIALDNRLLFEENQQVLRKLRKTNDKLKQMDETKDEFISMASHQLRTPLTSVKGYLSMVLEGDAGELGEMQHKLLDQAFVSSQRMVYLIADLLNVSRLRTGKFIIETTDSNLAEVVEGEVSQLLDTAKSRGLSLSYKKPAKFPVFMLDETKLRQVVMNFTDNAIYYTPAGGHITLKLVDKPSSIEFTVSDDGIGVPKAEQHHLFNKFYRAGNAQKARPDGTGLGLFMAQKVIIAQGGSIIFHSEEGKGSTFGFSFAKSRLRPPTKDDTTAK